MIRLATLLQFDINDPGDLQDFVRWLFALCLWGFYILTSIVVIAAIFKAGNGGLPPEPQWWIAFRAELFSRLWL